MERGDQVGAPRARLPLPRVPGAAAALHSLPLARDCPPAGSPARGVRAPRSSVGPGVRARSPQGSATASEPDCNQGPKLGAGGGAKEAVIYKRLLPDLACLLSEQAALSITHPAGWKNTSLAGPGAGPGAGSGRGRGALPLLTRGHTHMYRRAHTHAHSTRARAHGLGHTKSLGSPSARVHTAGGGRTLGQPLSPLQRIFPETLTLQPLVPSGTACPQPLPARGGPQPRLCAAPRLGTASAPQHSLIHLAPGRGLRFLEWQRPNHATASSRATIQVLSLDMLLQEMDTAAFPCCLPQA